MTNLETIKSALRSAHSQAKKGHSDAAKTWLREAKHLALLSGEEVRLTADELADVVDTFETLSHDPNA